MKKLGQTEKSNNYPIQLSFPFLGGVWLWKSKYSFFSMSGTATLLSKYGNAVCDFCFKPGESWDGSNSDIISWRIQIIIKKIEIHAVN